jgi:GNAT superfamily N-acetyltransferase
MPSDTENALSSTDQLMPMKKLERSESQLSLSDTVSTADTLTGVHTARPKVGRLIENVLGKGTREQAEAHWGKVLADADALCEAEFEDSIWTKLSKRGGRRLMLLVSPDEAECYGFLVYKWMQQERSLIVVKVAVVEELRGLGLGERMLRHAIGMATSNTAFDTVGLSANAAVHNYYRRFGFKSTEYKTPAERERERLGIADPEQEPRDSYMELRVRNFRCRTTS